VLIGGVDEIAEQLQRTRQAFGVSYYVLSDARLGEMAPVVERCAGA
jgi:hypothetical protein